MHSNDPQDIHWPLWCRASTLTIRKSCALVERENLSECIDFLQSIDMMLSQSVSDCERVHVDQYQGEKLYSHEKSLPQSATLPTGNHHLIRTALYDPVWIAHLKRSQYWVAVKLSDVLSKSRIGCIPWENKVSWWYRSDRLYPHKKPMTAPNMPT